MVFRVEFATLVMEQTSWKRNCNWEVTDSKKIGMPLSWQQLKRLSSFQTPSVTVQKHLSFPQCSRGFVQILIR